MGNGQSDISLIGTKRGEGYRIMNVKPNSPLDKKVDVFFDFIIDAVPEREPERTAKDILNKLTNDENRNQKSVKTLAALLLQNQNQTVTLKIVSTKYRNVRNVQILPNKDWSDDNDVVGIQTRVERYDEAFETYYPFTNIRPNSPIKKAHITQGEFIIACEEFKFHSINDLLDNIYDRFFDKQVQCKTIHFAIYNLVTDQLRVVPVLLERGWGQKGLLGCQFVQGQLNKFPKNLVQVRNQLISKKKRSEDTLKIKKQLIECSGASIQLLESLKNQKNRKNKNIRNLKSILQIQPIVHKPNPQNQQQETEEAETDMNNSQFVSLAKYKQLENRVRNLQSIICSLRQLVEKEVDQQVKQSELVQIM